MRPVFLIGYMGCGKSTLGKALASWLGIQFLDLDDYIEEKYETTINEIFAKAGAHKFREIEQQALREVAATSNAVIACGGGTPCFEGNMQLMNDSGLTIWLTTTPQRITSRLCLPEQKAKRPLIKDKPDAEILDTVTRGLKEREPFYSKAMLRFDSTRLESVEEINETARQLAELLKNSSI